MVTSCSYRNMSSDKPPSDISDNKSVLDTAANSDYLHEDTNTEILPGNTPGNVRVLERNGVIYFIN